jgi:hypothetical protein
LLVKPRHKKRNGIIIIAAIAPPSGARVTFESIILPTNALFVNNNKRDNNSSDTHKKAKLLAPFFKPLILFLYILFTKE